MNDFQYESLLCTCWIFNICVMRDWKKLENDQNFVSWTSFPMKVLIVVTQSLDTLIQNFISTGDLVSVIMVSHTWYRVNIIIVTSIRC